MHFESLEWDKARASANRIDNELLNLMVETQIDDVTLEKSLVGLKAALYGGNLIGEAKDLLPEKGICEEELSEFSTKIVVVVKAVKRKEFDHVEARLDEVQKLYALFMKRFA